MLSIFNEFRNKLDDIMLKCMHKRITLYGYDSYTGRFLKWYAAYYHGIEVDYLVSEDMSVGKGYDREIFRPSVFEFGFKDIKNTIIWLAQPLTDELRNNLKRWGFEDGNTIQCTCSAYFDFFSAIYGKDIYAQPDEAVDIFHKRKSGQRAIQFIEWLEWKYGCNFLQRIEKRDFEDDGGKGSNYSCSTQKEVFPILDRCHIHPDADDRIFDFGCGKGGAIISFLDYGFKSAGGVEYEKNIYGIAKDNFSRLQIDNVELLCGNAKDITLPLDKYNWFYFFNYIDRDFFKTVFGNIKESYLRNKRKLHIIYYVAMEHDFIEETGIFRLTNQFTVDSRQRVVGIFENFE